MQGLFAETDASGRVVCVWRKTIRDIVARPIQDAGRFQNDLGSLPCHGASKEAIADWFAREIKVRAEPR